MISSDLRGFSSWRKWSTDVVPVAPNHPGVYAFRLAKGPFGRVKGASDLVYIGCTEGAKRTLRQRLKNHLIDRSDQEDVGHRLCRVEREIGELDVAWKTFDNAGQGKQYEGELLAQYAGEHVEFPPLNRKESGKRFRKVWTAIQEVVKDKQQARVLVAALADELPPEKRAKILEALDGYFGIGGG